MKMFLKQEHWETTKEQDSGMFAAKSDNVRFASLFNPWQQEKRRVALKIEDYQTATVTVTTKEGEDV